MKFVITLGDAVELALVALVEVRSTRRIRTTCWRRRGGCEETTSE